MARRRKMIEAMRLATSKATAADLWDRLEDTYGTQTFLTMDKPLKFRVLNARALDYTDIRDVTARMAGALRKLGVRKGTRVCVCAGNRADYALALFAVMRIGAIAVPLHHHLTAGEVRELVKRSKSRFLIADEAAAVKMKGVTTLSLAPGGTLDEATSAALAVRPATIDATDTVAILFTSGTTGSPKGAQLTSRSLLAVARLAALTPDGQQEQGVCGLPLAHIAGLSTFLATALAGVKMHWVTKFKASRVLKAIEDKQATFFVGVPAMYSMMAEDEPEQRDLSSVKLWASGADAMPPALVERFRQLGCALKSPLGHRLFTAAFAEIYGMVELSGPAILRFTPPSPVDYGVTAPVRRVAARFAEIGKAFAVKLPGVSSSVDNPRRGYTLPIPPYRIRVVNDAGRTVPVGTVGELVVKGPGVTTGYMDDPEATARTTKDGWLFTGDLAQRNRLGQVNFVSRKKDVVKHGGFSVFPAEIEARMVHHPAVAEAVVLGAPHPTKGAVPVAVVVKTKNAKVDVAEMLEWCRETFAPYKAPRALIFVKSSEVPRNDNRKVLKAELADAVVPQMKKKFPDVFAPKKAARS